MMPKLCISALAEIHNFGSYFGLYLLSIFKILSIDTLKNILSGPISAALNVPISGVLKYTVKLRISVALSGLLNAYNSASISFGPEIHTESYIFGLYFI